MNWWLRLWLVGTTTMSLAPDFPDQPAICVLAHVPRRAVASADWRGLTANWRAEAKQLVASPAYAPQVKN